MSLLSDDALKLTFSVLPINSSKLSVVIGLRVFPFTSYVVGVVRLSMCIVLGAIA